MSPISMRLPSKLWERCGWAAHALGLSRSEWVRDTLEKASNGAKPPKTHENHEFLGTAAEWASWRKLAEAHNMPLEKFVPHVLNKLAERNVQPTN